MQGLEVKVQVIYIQVGVFWHFFSNALHNFLHNIVYANCWFMLFPISPPSSIFPSHKTYETYEKI